MCDVTHCEGGVSVVLRGWNFIKAPPRCHLEQSVFILREIERFNRCSTVSSASAFISHRTQSLYIINKRGNARITWHWGAFVQPLLRWKSNEYYMFWVCVCSLRYPACNAHAPFYHPWPVWLYNIFPHYLINGTIFEKKNVIEHKKCVLIFSTNLSKTFLILRKNDWDIIKTIYFLNFIYNFYPKHFSLYPSLP